MSHDAVLIDPVLDYDAAASTTWTESVEMVVAFLNEQKLKLHYVLETHAHADHLSGSQAMKQACPDIKVAIGQRITLVQKMFKPIFSLPHGFRVDGSQFDLLLDDQKPLKAGSLTVETLFTPGHTPACTSLKIEDALFTGDALFMPDSGTGRCDFPGGSARELYDSITRQIYSQPDATRIFVCHDYQPGGRALSYETTVGEEKRSNVALNSKTQLEEFVAFRERRDAQLAAPRLLFQSVQVNVDAGRLPQPEGDLSYLKVPLNFFKPKAPPNVQRLNTCEAIEQMAAQG
jgi:glyoxylase-like metal-dependent hydrolase (beta-lactamase superfamily II)